MKKAKIILISMAVLAIIAEAFAFETSRGVCNVWTLLAGSKVTSITVSGIVYTTTIPNCTHTNLRSTLVGTPVNVSSTTTDAGSTTRFISGTNFIIATFPYCTLWRTPTVACGDVMTDIKNN